MITNTVIQVKFLPDLTGRQRLENITEIRQRNINILYDVISAGRYMSISRKYQLSHSRVSQICHKLIRGLKYGASCSNNEELTTFLKLSIKEMHQQKDRSIKILSENIHLLPEVKAH